jgi:predicted MPP superfamily phosphohydrolase
VGKRLTGLMAAAGGAAVALYWYAHRLERGQVSLERFAHTVKDGGIPASGLTILHLSDFHFRAEDPVQEARLARLAELLEREQYDILAFTGDLIHDMAGLPRALRFFDGLHPRLAAFCVPGNRDYWVSGFKAVFGTKEERSELSIRGISRLIVERTRRMVAAFGGNERGALRITRNDVGAMLAELAARDVVPLMNRSARVTAPGVDLWFAGVDDMNTGRPDLKAALAEAPSSAPLVLLAHNPDVWLDPRSRRAFLILSGHTHGGQLRLPFIGSWYRQGTHLPRQKAAGWFEDGQSAMYVTRGLGESFPFRFGAPPQAALITLVSDESEEVA